jgi:hypothetical protein
MTIQIKSLLPSAQVFYFNSQALPKVCLKFSLLREGKGFSPYSQHLLNFISYTVGISIFNLPLESLA